MSHSSRSRKSEIKVLAGLVSSEISLLFLRMPSFCVFTWFCLGLCVILIPLHQDTSYIELRPTYMTSFPLNISFKVLSPNITHSDVRLQCRNLGGGRDTTELIIEISNSKSTVQKKKIKMLSLLASKRMLNKGKI